MPGGKFAKLAKLVAGSCNVAITKMIKGKKRKNNYDKFELRSMLSLKLKHSNKILTKKHK